MEKPPNNRRTPSQEAWQKLRRAVIPVLPPAAYGIGLIRIEVVLTPDEIARQRADLAALAEARRLPLPDDIVVT